MSKKLNLILDIDNTLLSAEPAEEFDFKKEKDKATKFKFHNMDEYYIIFERPNVQEFLDYAFKHYNVSIWTAASKDYAIYIINKVILDGHPERKNKIDYVFYCYHCDLSMEEMDGSKNLNMIWDKYNIPGYTKDNTFIMDDYDEVAATNPCNCIMVDPFNYYDEGSEKDMYLKNVIKKMMALKPGKDFLINGGLTPDMSYMERDDSISVRTRQTGNSSTNEDEERGTLNINEAPTSMDIDLMGNDDKYSDVSSVTDRSDNSYGSTK